MFTALSVLALAGYTLAATYSRRENIVGTGFLNSFTAEAIGDPTHGRVNYVSSAVAQSLNLTYASGNTFILRADHTTVLSASGVGRNSVRLKSNKQYTTGVMIFDVRHMPDGCGTWPAIWTLGNSWPNDGEIDIVEGVNNVSPNAATLHTGPSCTMPSSRSQTGTVTTTDCYAYANGNTGCGVSDTRTNSFGPPFNSNGGGWYVMERTNSVINVWFWPRNSAVPSDVQSGATSISTSSWGSPMATFPNTSCNLAQFSPHNIIINLTFCGDWAGNSGVYSSSGCPGTCVDYVNNNPTAFNNAYFDFASLNIYS